MGFEETSIATKDPMYDSIETAVREPGNVADHRYTKLPTELYRQKKRNYQFNRPLEYYRNKDAYRIIDGFARGGCLTNIRSIVLFKNPGVWLFGSCQYEIPTYI